MAERLMDNGQHATSATTPAGVRAEVDRWLEQHWDPDRSVAEWWKLLADAGLSNSMLPAPYGRGYSRDLAAAVFAAIAKRRLVGPPNGLGLMLAAPTIAVHGTAEQQARFLPGILDGSDGWCQLFSEPGAGSDLAGLQTRAERDGDEWVVNGQKVWTSTGQHADWGILIARTNPDAPKHQGISYFLFPMRQPGVEVRPLREMTGRAIFNEVFLDNARVHTSCLLGELNNGWAVANTTLMFERAGIGGGGGGFSSAIAGSVAGHLGRRVGDFVGRSGELSSGGVGVHTFNQLVDLAGRFDRLGDPIVRQQLAELHIRLELLRLTASRAKRPEAVPGAGNIAKICMTELVRHVRELAGFILGPELTLWGPESVTGGALQELVVFSPAPSIYGGTDEIQRNILGERVLGLPKEPGPAKETPFRELAVGTQRSHVV